MFNLLNQSKAQILIISNYEVKLLIWEKNILRYDSSYTDTTTGHEQFLQRLSSYEKLPLIIISNFIEETFRTESIIPVSGNDQKALFERKLNYTFRNTPYRMAKVIEREQEGRRDYKVLLSALTKPELLSPWIKAILSRKIAIQSISSMAYLSESFVQSTRNKSEEYLLLVSLEKGTELRQTFFKNGVASFSRLTSLSSQDANTLGGDIYRESLQIRSYLERIKLLPYDALLKINVFSNINNNEFSSSLINTDLNTFETFNTQAQAHAYNLELNDIEPSTTIIFLAHTLQKKRFKNTYAPFTSMRYHHLKTISRNLVYFSTALILSTLFLETPDLLKTLNNWDQQKQLINQTAPILKEYDELRQEFPETPIPSKEMELVVRTYERIKAQSYLPEDMLSIISRSLTFSPNLKLTSIRWELLEKKAEFSDQGFGFAAAQSADPQNAFKSAILENRSHVVVNISGFAFSPSSYREAQDQVQAFSNALSSYPEITVSQEKMPTDVRIDTSVSITVDGNEIRAPFVLKLDVGAAP